MAITPIKALLFLAGGTVAAGATAYVSGVLDPYMERPAGIASLPEAPAGQPDAKGERLPGKEPAAAENPAVPEAPAASPPAAASAPAPEKPVDQAALTPPVAEPAEPEAPAAAAPANAVPTAPSFDIVRVEANGSVVIAGKAGPDAKVEILNGAAVIGQSTADKGGDFAVIIDEPLKPGDYRLALRATPPGEAAVMSVETAIVSVPEKADGQVLAMVEEPGKPAEIISVPAAPPAASAPAPEMAAIPPATGEPAAAPATAAAEPAPAAPEKPAEVAAANPAPVPAEQAAPPVAVAAPTVAVEAVEIEGSNIFVAGAAPAGRSVRGYANDMVLGDALASPEGRFLIEAKRDLPVGQYLVRVDVLGPDGAVLARAAVPFEREPGESIAAVAPPAVPPAAAEQLASPPPVAAAEPKADPAAPAADTAPAMAAAPSEPPAGAAPAGEVTAAKLQSVDSAVIIRRGDTLWRISRRVYGHGIRYSTIYLANQKQIENPDKIWPGQVFKVPDTSSEGEKADLTEMGEQATTVPAETATAGQQ